MSFRRTDSVTGVPGAEVAGIGGAATGVSRSAGFRLRVAGAVLLGLLILVAVLAPWLAPYDPDVPAGMSFDAPSAQHLLGTNNIGQDVLSRVIWGTRTSLPTAAAVTAIAVFLGIVVGAVAGLAGGVADLVCMRIVDVLIALPRLPLLILVGVLAGATRVSVVLALGLLAWAPIARVLRNQTLSLRRCGFIEAARGFGAGGAYLIRRHVAAALGPVVIAQAMAVASSALLLETGLAFLGVADSNAVSWGLDINRALAEPGVYFSSAWLWWVLPTGMAIVTCVGAFIVLGIGMEPLANRRVEVRR
ncbi:ABC transporter permease subunit [Phytoactinopolyspora mesophila]|uniref:ABC transporter permease subunit n=1 Tax=Phytoactinopolyspora mesophila TaxID=2650750 RepID=UPI001390CF6D